MERGRGGDRRWMGVTLFPEDLEGLTCPATYPFPASPHLAAELAGEPLDVEHLVRCASLAAAF